MASKATRGNVFAAIGAALGGLFNCLPKAGPTSNSKIRSGKK